MKKLLLAFALLLLVAGSVAGVFWLQVRAFLDTPVTPPEGRAVVEVAPGTTLAALGRDLDAAGVIEDRQLPGVGSLFYAWAHKVRQAAPRLKSGEYVFEGPATPDEVLDKVVRGQVRTWQVTVPEGLRLDEIVPLFEAAGLGDAEELLALARDPAFVRELGVPADTLEGYLFPDTYTFAKGVSPRKILSRAVSRFDAAYAGADAQRAEGVDLDRHQAVTLASIIEKETGAPEERPRIACVFHNRLKQGMRLQTDPTVIYAKFLRGGWDGNLTRADLERSHPYNTYTVKGLPPGPIASPGKAALEAALNPADCDDLYFVSRGNGTHVFCPTYGCHLRAVEQFQLRRRRGG